MSAPIGERRRSSADRFLGAFAKGIRRVSLTRRGSSDNDLPTQSSQRPPPQPVAKRPSMDSIPASVRSPSMVSSRSASSLQAPVAKLNSSSPASELPKTWAEWNYAYANGFIDFDDPPPPPTDLSASEHATITGQFRAPFPLNEAKRQRAVDNIGALLFNQGQQQNRRPSLQDPKDATAPLSPKAPPPVPPPEYRDDGSVPPLGADKVPPAYPNGVGGTQVDAPAPLNDKNAVTKRQEGPMHPALEKLAQEAKEKFGVSATTVSLMDRDEQVFLSDSSCTFLEDRDSVPRELTCCSHAQLKFSTGTKDPLVILDFAKDWRFNKNGFGDYQKGFYAAAPIMLPAPMGDEAGSYPGGIFCLLGEQPRAQFTEQERVELQDMADKASVEIQKFAQQQRKTRKDQLGKKRQEWKKSKLVRRVSGQPSLDTVVELPTPPMTPDMANLHIMSDEDQAEDDLVAQADQFEPPRRPSLAESIGSDGSETDLQTTAVAPVFGQRQGGPVGVLARPASDVPAEVQSVLDLSTQLVAESIEMDFAFLVALDVPAAQKWTPAASSSTKSPLRLISVHGMPIPPPLFSVDSALEPLVGETKSVLFINEQFNGADGDFSTGLLCKIAQHGDTGYLLGCFSEDSRRVLNGEDLMFLRSFSRDLSKYTVDL
ncbi:hypothetical protein JCM8097_006309 [Rhodosporidiobolus ruineniae]